MKPADRVPARPPRFDELWVAGALPGTFVQVTRGAGYRAFLSTMEASGKCVILAAIGFASSLTLHVELDGSASIQIGASSIELAGIADAERLSQAFGVAITRAPQPAEAAA